MNENSENHNSTDNAATDADDALKNISEEILSLPDTNPVKFEQQQQQNQHRNRQQQKQRIFIDQIFNLAQDGKLTLQDIMNESQSMVVVVSFIC